MTHIIYNTERCTLYHINARSSFGIYSGKLHFFLSLRRNDLPYTDDRDAKSCISILCIFTSQIPPAFCGFVMNDACRLRVYVPLHYTTNVPIYYLGLIVFFHLKDTICPGPG